MPPSLSPSWCWQHFSASTALTCSSLWHDEGNAWALAQRSFARIAVDAAADIHPPGYYWLLKLWGGPFGYSAWGMRSLSALAGLLAVAVIYRLGLETGDVPRAARIQLALLAALLAALNPFQVFYSQEARMYALPDARVGRARLGTGGGQEALGRAAPPPERSPAYANPLPGCGCGRACGRTTPLPRFWPRPVARSPGGLSRR